MSIFIGGGQDYYGPTAERDKEVVKRVATLLRKTQLPLQIVTGGTAGIPEDFARHFGGLRLSGTQTVVNVIAAEYLETYKERTRDYPQSYWVAAETHEQRRVALANNPDIKVGLFIQGGQFTTHEIWLFQEKGKKLVVFSGSGGASGGAIPYNGWSYVPPTGDKAYMSTDPDADVADIAYSLVQEILAVI